MEAKGVGRFKRKIETGQKWKGREDLAKQEEGPSEHKGGRVAADDVHLLFHFALLQILSGSYNLGGLPHTT